MFNLGCDSAAYGASSVYYYIYDSNWVISLLNAEYKFSAKIICRRVQTNGKNLIIIEQSGFCKGCSTIDVFVLKQLIEKKIQTTNPTGFY